MYSIIPIMSFVMAINGPVAMAGSIFSFSSVIGTSVPKMEANITTANNKNKSVIVAGLISFPSSV